MINRDKNKIPEQFKIFYPYMKEHFYKNYDKILEFVESKKDLVDIYFVQIYSMQTSVNYNKLKDKLIETKHLLDVDFDKMEKEDNQNK
jgi:hypothetical protein